MMSSVTDFRRLAMVGVMLVAAESNAQELTAEQRTQLAEIEKRNQLATSVPAQMLIIRDLVPMNPATGRPYPTIGPAPDRPLKTLKHHLAEIQRQRDGAGEYWNGVKGRFAFTGTASILLAATPLAPLGLIGGVISSVGGQIAESAAQRSADEHYNTVKRIVEGYASTLGAENRARVFRDLGPENPERHRQKALADLGEGLDKLFQEANPKSLSKEGVIAATPAMLVAIRDGLINARALQKAEAARLGQRITAVEGALENSERSFQSLEKSVMQTRSAADALQAAVPKLQTSLHVTNAMLLSRMSATEQLNALKEGIDIGLDATARKELIDQLEPRAQEEQHLGRVRNAQQTANDIATVASTTLNVARAVGIDVPEEVDRAVSIGHSLFNVATGFAINPIAGIGALNGALGVLSGPRSPASDPKVLQALQNIRKDLGEIRQLQQETLAKLSELDAKLTTQYEQIVKRLERIEGKIDALVTFAYQEVYLALGQCGLFQRRIADLRKEGKGRYEDLVTLFNASDTVRDEYRLCRAALKHHTLLPNQSVHPLFTQGVTVTGGKVAATTDDAFFYQPVVNLMNFIYMGRQDWCDQHIRIMTTLSESMVGHEQIMASCTVQDWKPDRLRFSFGNFPLISYQDTLKSLIHHDARVKDPSAGEEVSLFELLSRYQSAIAPLHELMGYRDGVVVLLTATELEQRFATANIPSEAEEQGARLLDLVALAALQESMMAGVGMFPKIWEAVQASLQPERQPGGKADVALDFGGASENGDFMRSCDISPVAAPNAIRLACLFERHPYMLANTVVWQLRRAMTEVPGESPDASRVALYGLAMTHRSQDFMNRATSAGAFPIRWQEDSPEVYGFVYRREASEKDEVGKGAYFKYRASSGSVTYLPAPTEQEVASGLIKYRPQAYGLIRTRQVLYEEHLLYQLHRPVGKAQAMPPKERGFIAVHALNSMLTR